jgi:glycerol transport system ATP-binding protein
MGLELKQISTQVGGRTHLHPISLSPRTNELTVLLGATLAGKTSLMRVMAGLDRPNSGSVWVDRVDVTGESVRKRNVAMVYQQFINYPSMTVYDNIASPLRLKGGLSESDLDQRVRNIADRLHIDPYLSRLPAELSGGQQQRVALARALVKNAPLTLLDEPLVNLDYKLREELRDELTQLFEAGESTIIYATTEPSEALILGGYTAVLAQGKLLQYGPTREVFHRPINLAVAKAFSDPPLNVIDGQSTSAGILLAAGMTLEIGLPSAKLSQDAMVTVGLRANAFTLQKTPGSVMLNSEVALAEISGSDTFVHVSTPLGSMVAQVPGVHVIDLGARLPIYLQPSLAYVFDQNQMLIHAPHDYSSASFDAARG